MDLNEIQFLRVSRPESSTSIRLWLAKYVSVLMYLYAKVANLPNDPKLFTCGGGGIHTKKHIHTLFPFGWLAK